MSAVHGCVGSLSHDTVLRPCRDVSASSVNVMHPILPESLSSAWKCMWCEREQNDFHAAMQTADASGVN